MLTDPRASRARIPLVILSGCREGSRTVFRPSLRTRGGVAGAIQSRQLLHLPDPRLPELCTKYVKFSYDPATHELAQIVMPFDTMSENTTLTLDKGWVTKASVEDVKLLPGVHRTMFELPGGEWVAREVAQSVKSGRAKFILSTGDLVWWGAQGEVLFDNPYWKLVDDDVVKQLPAPDDQMRAAGLPGRLFPAVGNHEVWHDPNAGACLELSPI